MKGAKTTGLTVITGADRGLGLALATQYAEDGANVVAGCLGSSAQPVTELPASRGDMEVIRLDVTSESSVAAFKDRFDGRPIELLINNAGVHFRKWSIPEEVVFADWEQTFRVNTLGPARVSFALRPQLISNGTAKLITISSDWGSISKHPGTAYDYCSSKAAVNSLMRGMATSWIKDGITIAMIHPGWTRTEMGGADAPDTPDVNAARVREVIAGLTPQDNGRYMDNMGRDMPW